MISRPSTFHIHLSLSLSLSHSLSLTLSLSHTHTHTLTYTGPVPFPLILQVFDRFFMGVAMAALRARGSVVSREPPSSPFVCRDWTGDEYGNGRLLLGTEDSNQIAIKLIDSIRSTKI